MHNSNIINFIQISSLSVPMNYYSNNLVIYFGVKKWD